MSTVKAWPVLTAYERRVLGVLVEKAKTTPDAYPLTINALVTGCNQKSNRDPVMSLEDLDVEDALISVQKKGLAIRITGSGRVEKWRHNLYEAWTQDKVELAILAELLLRGPQTEGELRARASRMDPLDDLDTLRTYLRGLAERKLVVYLSPEGRRGTMVTHGFHEPVELDRLKSRHANAGEDDTPVTPPPARVVAPVPPPAVPATPTAEPRLAEALAEVARLRERVAQLETRLTAMEQLSQTITTLAAQVQEIRQGLGI